MDEEGELCDRRAMIALLLLEAGRIMEDGRVALALALPRDDDDLAARLSHARVSADAILALVSAARVLHRRRPSQD